jgi:hypothetical protein
VCTTSFTVYNAVRSACVLQVLDDDLQWNAAAINRFFSIFNHYQLHLAQPSLCRCCCLLWITACWLKNERFERSLRLQHAHCIP